MIKLILEIDGKSTEFVKNFARGVEVRKVIDIVNKSEKGELNEIEQIEAFALLISESFNDERVTYDAIMNDLNYPAMGYESFQIALQDIGMYFFTGGISAKKMKEELEKEI